MAKTGENRYGKSRVRLSRITRHGDRHDFNEWTVRVLLEGDFESSFTEADNSKILPTDTMKNTVYSVARGSKAATIEEFAMELGDYLLDNNPQVSKVSVEIEEKAWERMIVDGAPEPTTFKLGGPECTRCAPCATRDASGPSLRASMGCDSEDHQVRIHRLHQRQADHAQAGDRSHLRHQRHGHVGVCGHWPPDYALVRAALIAALLKEFAAHHSMSVQHTLFDMGKPRWQRRRRLRASSSPCPTCTTCWRT
jgi:urate oxidase